MEKFDEFDEQPAIHQSFPTKLFSLIVSSMERTINLSKFCLSKVYVYRLHSQSFAPSNFCALRYLNGL